MSRTAKVYAAVSAALLLTQTHAAAQSYDPHTQSPLILLTSPADGLAYFDARAQAIALMSQGKPADAEPLVEQITRDYPRDGSNWLLLGQVKRALGKPTEAAIAFERADELLWSGGGNAGVGAAITHLQAGNRRAALDEIRHYITNTGNMDRSWIYGEDDFATLLADPEFLELAGRPDTTGWSRDYGWRQDLAFLRNEVLRLNAEYRGGPLPPEFERLYEDLSLNVPRLSDDEIYVGMNRMLAVFRQGHTAVWTIPTSRPAYKGLPVQLWAFPEGIFIVGAGEGHANLVGSRLVSIEGVAAEEALRRVNETQSVDGDNEYLFSGVDSLREANFLVGLGIAQSSDRIGITVQAPDGAVQTMTMATSTFRPSTRLLPVPEIETPLFLREAQQFHRHEALPEHDALYVQLNSLSDEPDETLIQYGLRLRGELTTAPPGNLIIDMRHNGGGSTHLYAELLRTIVAYSVLPGRKVYVLISRQTYSAAGNLITEMEQLAGAVFLGEASSECCTFYGSPSPFTLPYSGLRGRMSAKRWSLSRKGHDFRRELNPQVPVQLTAANYFAGQDPVMETLFRMIARDRAAGPAEAASAPAGQN